MSTSSQNQIDLSLVPSLECGSMFAALKPELDIQIDEFNGLRDADRYSDEDKEQMISWFNTRQRDWGVNQLILEAVNAFATEIPTEQ